MEKNVELKVVPEAYTGVDNLEAMALAVNYNQFLLDEMIDSAGGETGQWLDFGAGSGTFALKAKHAGKNVMCVESDGVLQDRLRAHHFEVHPSLDPLPESSIDHIYTLNVLEHIERDTEVLKGLYRILKPKKKLYIYVPAMSLLFTSMDRKVGHVRRYSRAELLKKVSEAGFQVESCSYCDSVGFFVTLLFKYIGNDRGEITPSSIKIYDRFLFPFNALFDRLFASLLGKNLRLVAIKP